MESNNNKKDVIRDELDVNCYKKDTRGNQCSRPRPCLYCSIET